MDFILPKYAAPDFAEMKFAHAHDAKTAVCEKDGIAPDGFHATSMYPEYFKVGGTWKLAEESRMDGVVRIRDDGSLDVVELRNLHAGDRIILGRSTDCAQGIYLHTDGFSGKSGEDGAHFAFRTKRSRETAFSIDYDHLYSLLMHEREHGNIVWVMGPACVFDFDSRRAFSSLTDNGYAHGVLGGNALAVHDLEGSYLRTALGQDLYTQEQRHNGHYNHMDTINAVRRSGSIPEFIRDHNIEDGIMHSIVKNRIPFVLASSIRDDGPLPEVIHSAYDAQAAMRDIIRKATTIICLATQLHTIATGNMTPSYRVVGGEVRPLYIYSVDISEFATNKLSDRGSLSAIAIVTNVQDFIVNVAKGVGVKE